MAVTKLKAYHSEQAINNALNYIEDSKKTALTEHLPKGLTPAGISFGTSATENALAYAMNPAKTTINHEKQEIQLISGWRVKPSIAPKMFTATADLYHRNGHNEHVGKKYRVKTLLRAKLDKNGIPVLDENGAMIHDPKAPVWHDADGNTITFDDIRTTKARTSFMWVMAFPPKEVCGFDIDPKLIHQIGREYMEALEEATQLQFQAVITTHVDKAHIHNHILQNAYSLDGHHKYVDTMETLQMARDISDRLSLKYNLPIILEPEQERSMNWNEWKLAKEGKSWKDNLRKEIEYAASKAGNYPDFIKCMESSGYHIRETANHLTYYTPGKTHRCRDSGLGTAYTKASIQALYEQAPLYQQVQQEASVLPAPDTEKTSLPKDPTLHNASEHKPLRIYVARYTKNGRRRSDLEMLLLKAIKIIQALNDRFHEPDISSDNPCSQTAAVKAQSLTEALGILQTLNIQTEIELDDKLNAAGTNYSHAKKVYTDAVPNEAGLNKLKDLLEDFQELKQWAESIGITDVCLLPLKEREIRKERAALFPMTPSQRRELFLALQKHPTLKTAYSYDNLTYNEAKECLDFLSSRRKEQPPYIIPVDTTSGKPQDKSLPPIHPAYVQIPEPTQKMLEAQWNDSMANFSYEDRCFAEEYRQAAKQLLSLGYTPLNPETALQNIHEQLKEIATSRAEMNIAKEEYKTLKQLQLYCSLAQSNTSFVYGNRYQEAMQKIETIEETKERTTEDIEPPRIRQFSRSERIDIS